MNERDKPQEQTLTQALAEITPLSQALAEITPERIAQELSAVKISNHNCLACEHCNELTPLTLNALLL